MSYYRPHYYIFFIVAIICLNRMEISVAVYKKDLPTFVCFQLVSSFCFLYCLTLDFIILLDNHVVMSHFKSEGVIEFEAYTKCWLRRDITDLLE